MLPGSVGTCEMFFEQIAALAPAIRLIAVSYPAEPDPFHLADGLARLMDQIGLRTASILGSSFGGYWAQFVALRHAARVDHLFLGNIFVSPEPLFVNPLFAPDFVRDTPAAALQAVWRRRRWRRRPMGSSSAFRATCWRDGRAPRICTRVFSA